MLDVPELLSIGSELDTEITADVLKLSIPELSEPDGDTGAGVDPEDSEMLAGSVGAVGVVGGNADDSDDSDWTVLAPSVGETSADDWV